MSADEVEGRMGVGAFCTRPSSRVKSIGSGGALWRRIGREVVWRKGASLQGQVCPKRIGKGVIELEEVVVSSEQEEASEQSRSEDRGEDHPSDSGLSSTGDGRRQEAAPTQSSDLSPQPLEEVERLKGELAEAHARMLAACRRALLAENAGRIVPELVAGSTVEEMEGSLEAARRAFETARAAALAEMASAPVPAGNPIRQGPAIDGMSPIEKIAYGLKRE